MNLKSMKFVCTPTDLVLSKSSATVTFVKRHTATEDKPGYWMVVIATIVLCVTKFVRKL